MVSAFSSVEDGVTIELIKGKNRILFNIPDLPLRIGHYFVSCGLYGPDIDSVYDFKDSICDFSIVGPRTQSFGFGGGGIMHIPHHWKIL